MRLLLQVLTSLCALSIMTAHAQKDLNFQHHPNSGDMVYSYPMSKLTLMNTDHNWGVNTGFGKITRHIRYDLTQALAAPSVTEEYYALNGQKLIEIDSQQINCGFFGCTDVVRYVTSVESSRKITHTRGFMNDSWEVIEADGSKAIYGNGGLSTRGTWKAVDYSYPMYIPTGKDWPTFTTNRYIQAWYITSTEDAAGINKTTYSYIDNSQQLFDSQSDEGFAPATLSTVTSYFGNIETEKLELEYEISDGSNPLFEQTIRGHIAKRSAELLGVSYFTLDTDALFFYDEYYLSKVTHHIKNTSGALVKNREWGIQYGKIIPQFEGQSQASTALLSRYVVTSIKDKGTGSAPFSMTTHYDYQAIDDLDTYNAVNASQYLYIPVLLSRITNHHGGVQEFTWEVNEQKKKFVLSSSTRDNGFGQRWDTLYTYDNQILKDENDNFKSFQKVSVTDPLGKVIETHYGTQHTKTVPITKKVKVNGILLSQSTYEYLLKSNPQKPSEDGSKYVLLSAVKSMKFASPNFLSDSYSYSKITYSNYDDYGNPRTIVDYGDLSSNYTTVFDSDETITTTFTYHNDLSKWLIGLKKTEWKLGRSYDSNNNNWVASSTLRQYNYDAFGRLTTSDIYNGADWSIPSSRERSIVYNSHGKPASITDANGIKTDFTYNSAIPSFVETETRSLEDSISYQYDDYMRVASQTNANNTSTHFEYDVFGRIHKEQVKDKNATKVSEQIYYYHDNVSPSYVKKRTLINNGQYLDNWVMYDGLGQAIKEQKLTTVNGSQSYVTLFRWPAQQEGASLATRSLTSYQSEWIQGDVSGYPNNPAHSPYRKQSNRTLLRAGHTDSDVPPNGPGSTVTIFTDTAGNKKRNVQWGELTHKESYNKETSSWETDSMSQQESRKTFRKIEYYGNSFESITTLFTYDTLTGELNQIAHTDGSKTAIDYDHLGRKVSFDDPDAGLTQNTYNSRNLLTSTTDANGVVIRYEYDAQNRVTKKGPDNGQGGITNGQDTVLYSYYSLAQGAGSQLKSISGETLNLPIGIDTSITVTRAIKKYVAPGGDGYSAIHFIDAAGNLKAERKVIDGVSYDTFYSYNKAGMLTSTTYPDGEVVTQTLSFDKVTGVSGANNYVSNVQYNVFDKVTQQTFGNGVNTVNSYYGAAGDSAGNAPFALNRRLTSKGSRTYQDLNYDYNQNSLIASITDGTSSFNNESFEYDRMKRLTRANSSLYGNKTYRYGHNGNLLEKDGYNYEYFAGTHRAKSDGRYHYAYDNVGNMTSKVRFSGNSGGNTQAFGGEQLSDPTYEWDSFNRLKAIKRDGATHIEAFYDGELRYKKVDHNKNIQTLYIGNHYEIEQSLINGSSSVRKYYYLNGERIAQRTSQTLSYLHTNHLGSLHVSTNSHGFNTSEFHYTPFGEQVSSWQHDNDLFKRTYTGQIDDGDDLMYYNARYYNPSLGRFISADTVVPVGGAISQSLNRYSYVNNSPIMYNDPTGHFWEVVDEIGGAIIEGMHALASTGNEDHPLSHQSMKERGVTSDDYVGGVKTFREENGRQIAAAVISVSLTALGGVVYASSFGLAAPLGNGLISAGVNGLVYTISNYDDFRWDHYGISTGVGFATGFIAGGTSALTTKYVASKGVSMALNGLANAGGGATVSYTDHGMRTGEWSGDGAAMSAGMGAALGAVDGGAGGWSAVSTAPAREASKATAKKFATKITVGGGKVFNNLYLREKIGM
ncbi:RHS repeat domain-containing protein [Pleionea sp. CnH1-48]|uniref:RHS repeat domain-containing protein n=1 Tax=Pleionea sp. CnH1-48 TaxID=2954494 RepID=UPI002096CFFA|nr:RHS repeat-associated core domain-containing protein [Pleionea sp. CnH1-48]MCO7224203.1 hypothetical protein [Pleionea sp. CnH1-48]